MNIYVASSWRNQLQPGVVEALRAAGHDVYDFRNPYPGNTGFAWSAIDPKWQEWTPEQYRAALQHPIAKDGYALDIGALRRCDACVLVLPSGRSASWEFGYAMGQGKPGAVLQIDAVEPELMYREAAIVTSMAELLVWAESAVPAEPAVHTVEDTFVYGRKRTHGLPTAVSLGDALPAEIRRVRDVVLPAYLEIGAAGAFAAASMRRDLDAATKALVDGDVVAMLRAHEALKGWKP